MLFCFFILTLTLQYVKIAPPTEPIKVAIGSLISIGTGNVITYVAVEKAIVSAATNAASPFSDVSILCTLTYRKRSSTNISIAVSMAMITKFSPSIRDNLEISLSCSLHFIVITLSTFSWPLFSFHNV